MYECMSDIETLCLYGFAYCEHFIQIESCNVIFCDRLFSLSIMFSRSMLRQVSVLHSFSWPYNNPLYGETTVCLSIHQLMGMGLFPLWGLL